MSASTSLDPRLPFSRADARAAGITVATLLSRRYQKVFHDLYVSADLVVDVRIRARAALHAAPAGSWASHATAAELWGLPVMADGLTHIAVPEPAGRLRRAGVRSHIGRGDVQPTVVAGIPVTSPAQTFLDLSAAGAGLVDLVVVGDAIIRADLCSLHVLEAAVAAHQGLGTAVARRAVTLLRAGVDSPTESRLRMLIVLAGLPEPAVNVIVRDEDGNWRMRFDLCYRAERVIVEYDGRQHAESTSQWERDLERREELERLGYRLVVVTARGLYVEPERTLERIRSALADRGTRARIRPSWRRHFPAAPR